jgi:hypothetical protein
MFCPEAWWGREWVLTVLFPPHVGGELRNNGQETTVVLAAFVGEAVSGTPVVGTPTA